MPRNNNGNIILLPDAANVPLSSDVYSPRTFCVELKKEEEELTTLWTTKNSSSTRRARHPEENNMQSVLHATVGCCP